MTYNAIYGDVSTLHVIYLAIPPGSAHGREPPESLTIAPNRGTVPRNEQIFPIQCM